MSGGFSNATIEAALPEGKPVYGLASDGLQRSVYQFSPPNKTLLQPQLTLGHVAADGTRTLVSTVFKWVLRPPEQPGLTIGGLPLQDAISSAVLPASSWAGLDAGGLRRAIDAAHAAYPSDWTDQQGDVDGRPVTFHWYRDGSAQCGVVDLGDAVVGIATEADPSNLRISDIRTRFAEYGDLNRPAGSST